MVIRPKFYELVMFFVTKPACVLPNQTECLLIYRCSCNFALAANARNPPLVSIAARQPPSPQS